ncbi:hypothetical protein PR202_ga05276 [Eleusine coracana subsp. coracana]|uniref:NAC domain-containing protein n=1 Tax=Eleusine coracana subsp. coracana TaxID=191504 RepID=A0AAV5BQW4_ELECO|nr:hypothetical protein PR202_ga04823 [Eleusine coracana subsp. coracana]GJM89126.1 hypothetical protein PR202_ga05276 [Eleusine coracana subsp. coracana]
MAELLPPGFRFYPTEEELIRFYLRASSTAAATATSSASSPSPTSAPTTRGSFQAQAHPRACAGGEPWFYFCRRQEREARGGRPSRTTPSGYWKAAGTPGWVYAADGRPIASRKTMVFYRGRAPGGTKTEWKINEYRAVEDDDVAAPPPSHALRTRSEFSLCRLYKKSGCPRQFDRRPSAAAAAMAGGGRQNPSAASCSTAALANVEETANKKRKRSQQNDDTTSSDGDGGRGHWRQQLLAHQGAADGLADGADDCWAQFLESFPSFDAENLFP